MVLSILFISLLAVLGPADVRAEVGCIDLEQCVNHETDITAFILQDYRGGHNVGGKLFVGGNADLKNSTIGNALFQSNGNEDHLVAGGDVSFFSGLMEKGNLVHGGKVLLASQVAESMGYNGVQKNSDRFDFARAGACLADKCGELKKMMSTANSTSEKSLNLVGHSDGVNVFDVSCHDIQEVTSVSIKAPQDSTVMVRVGPSEHCDISGKNIHVTDSATLLWNFCDTSKVFIEDMDFKGTLFAPASEIFAERASFANQVFAGNWHGDAEMNHRPFKGCSAADSEIPEVAELVQLEEVVPSRDVVENLLFDDQQLFLEASTGDLFLEVASGDLFLEVATGDLFLEAATGDLFLEAATGDLFLEAATGDLFLEAATGDLFLEAATGDLFLEVATGDLFLEVATGDLFLEVATGDLFLEAFTGDLFLETSTGDLFLEEDLVDEEPSALIMLETSTGEFFLETDSSSHNLPNLFLESSTGELFLETGSGDLFLEASSGDLFLEASSGDLFLEASSGAMFLEASSGDLFLEASSGDLFLEASSGDLFLEASSGDLFLEE